MDLVFDIGNDALRGHDKNCLNMHLDWLTEHIGFSNRRLCGDMIEVFQITHLELLPNPKSNTKVKNTNYLITRFTVIHENIFCLPI